MLNRIILAITISIFLASIVAAQTNEPTKQAQIDITAVTNKIRWDGDIIRTWEATGNVVVEYTRGEKRFYCTAAKVSFNRQGDCKPFIDELNISGDIHANLNGIRIESENLILTSDADNYSIDSETETKIETDSGSILTKLLHFDASNGIGNFQDGAEFSFFLDDKEPDSQRNPRTGKTDNMFGQCLSIDTSGGRLIAPAMELLYTYDDIGKFKASRVMMPSGGELLPLVSINSSESKFVFGCVEFNIGESRLVASNQIKLVKVQKKCDYVFHNFF